MSLQFHYLKSGMVQENLLLHKEPVLIHSSCLMQLSSWIREIGEIHKLPLYTSLERKEEVEKKRNLICSVPVHEE